MIMRYQYRAKIIRVYDGDTVYADIDLGFGVWLHNQIIRLHGIDTPELRGEEREEGLISKQAVEDLILNKEVMIQTFKDKKGKYGRWLADIHVPANGGLLNVNDYLITEGYAEIYK